MNYIFSIAKSIFDYSNEFNPNSKPIIISAVRDLLLIAESYMVNNIMVKTANNQKNTAEKFHVDELMNSLKNTNRDILDVLKNIEYLQNNMGLNFLQEKQQHYLAEKTANRLAQLRNEAVVIKDYKLAYEIENIFENLDLI